MKPRPRGIPAIGLFPVFGALAAALAGITLVWRGTPIGCVWSLNPRAWRQLAPLGKAVGIPFLALAAALAAAAAGWFRRRLWGWRLAVAIVAMQVCGDLVNLFLDTCRRASSEPPLPARCSYTCCVRRCVPPSGAFRRNRRTPAAD